MDKTSSLSDFREIGCKSIWTVHISPLFWAIEPTIALQNRQNLPSPSQIFAAIPKVRQAANQFNRPIYSVSSVISVAKYWFWLIPLCRTKSCV